MAITWPTDPGIEFLLKVDANGASIFPIANADDGFDIANIVAQKMLVPVTDNTRYADTWGPVFSVGIGYNEVGEFCHTGAILAGGQPGASGLPSRIGVNNPSNFDDASYTASGAVSALTANAVAGAPVVLQVADTTGMSSASGRNDIFIELNDSSIDFVSIISVDSGTQITVGQLTGPADAGNFVANIDGQANHAYIIGYDNVSNADSSKIFSHHSLIGQLADHCEIISPSWQQIIAGSYHSIYGAGGTHTNTIESYELAMIMGASKCYVSGLGSTNVGAFIASVFNGWINNSPGASIIASRGVVIDDAGDSRVWGVGIKGTDDPIVFETLAQDALFGATEIEINNLATLVANNEIYTGAPLCIEIGTRNGGGSGYHRRFYTRITDADVTTNPISIADVLPAPTLAGEEVQILQMRRTEINDANGVNVWGGMGARVDSNGTSVPRYANLFGVFPKSFIANSIILGGEPLLTQDINGQTVENDTGENAALIYQQGRIIVGAPSESSRYCSILASNNYGRWNDYGIAFGSVAAYLLATAIRESDGAVALFRILMQMKWPKGGAGTLVRGGEGTGLSFVNLANAGEFPGATSVDLNATPAAAFIGRQVVIALDGGFEHRTVLTGTPGGAAGTITFQDPLTGLVSIGNAVTMPGDVEVLTDEIGITTYPFLNANSAADLRMVAGTTVADTVKWMVRYDSQMNNY